MKILIADDSRVMRQIVIRTLRPAGFDGHDLIEAADGRRTIRSSGYALNLLRGHIGRPGERPDTLEHQSWFAQLAMRAALQPWMDIPIAYPLLTVRQPDESQRLEARKLTAQHGLGEPTWRSSAELQAIQ